MTAKIKSQIIAGIFALATAWLGFAYQQKSSSAADLAAENHKMRTDIEQLKATLSSLRTPTQGQGASPLNDIVVIRARIQDILTIKDGAIERLRNTSNLTPELVIKINAMAAELASIDNQLAQVVSH